MDQIVGEWNDIFTFTCQSGIISDEKEAEKTNDSWKKKKKRF